MPLAKAGSAAPSTSGVSRRRSRPTPRQRLLDGATKLFTTEGIRVIGIDRILREADVAKASLYSLFGSKDALVIAYLKRMDEQWRQAYQERIVDLKTPDEKILAFFRPGDRRRAGEAVPGVALPECGHRVSAPRD